MRSYLSKITQTTKRQQTLKREVRLSGIGVHTGAFSTVRILPAPEHNGIRFLQEGILIPARYQYVTCTHGATTIASRNKSVQTIEHLLASLSALEIHNATIDILGPEVPILDGSAKHWVDAIVKAGIVTGKSAAEAFILSKPYFFKRASSMVLMEPAPNTRILCRTTLQKSVQSFGIRLNPTAFSIEIASARTYVDESAFNHMTSAGLLKGAVPSCGILLKQDLPQNTHFRMRNECARHKMLDFIGDLALLGAPLLAKIRIFQPNHTFNHNMIEDLATKTNHEHRQH